LNRTLRKKSSRTITAENFQLINDNEKNWANAKNQPNKASLLMRKTYHTLPLNKHGVRAV
tara:strand:- start:94 stop:273 length:180 start_codon:yes stop_codon:yes gene_type:complete